MPFPVWINRFLIVKKHWFSRVVAESSVPVWCRMGNEIWRLQRMLRLWENMA